MQRRQLKAQLILYREGADAPLDLATEAAIAQGRKEPELVNWLKQTGEFHKRMERHLGEIEVPAGLRERILTSQVQKKKTVAFPRRAFVVTALAAAITLVVSLRFWHAAGTENHFDSYRQRMARTALRDYRMNMVSRSQPEIRRYLQLNGPHGDYILSKKLAQVPGQGCALLAWNGRPVSMICLDGGIRKELFLFIIDRKAVSDPPPTTPQFSQVSELATYSWSNADKIYLLGGKSGSSALEDFL